MVWDWEGKRDVCYQMYIQDRKALEEVMEYMKNTYHFAPSKRAFQTQFKRWGFPSKQNPAHKNAELVARVKQLWEQNVSQRDMLKILNEEGFAIKERELMRVRAKNRWLLRVPNGMKPQASSETETPRPDEPSLLALEEEVYKQDNEAPAAMLPSLLSFPSRGLSPGALAKRKERLERLKAESDDRWLTRKRRRRTRGWAGLPPDPPGPPRFPSETTIDESKRYLNLDNAMYRQIRDRFQRICQEAGFLKKTVAGPERWQAAKDRLIQECTHLQQVFWIDTNQLDAKNLALDVVCTDVTKRMRTLEQRMTIAEAKNALGINPEESRQIRTAFYSILKADHFTSKLEAGDDHWKQLKDRWIDGSGLLQRILAPGPADPENETKLRALEVLCRDVMKRLRDDQAKRDPTRKRDNVPSDGQEPVTPSNSNTKDTVISAGISMLASRALARAQLTSNDIGEIQIDPSLLQGANGPSFGTHVHSTDVTHFGYVNAALDSTAIPLPVYLRTSPQSQLHPASRTWVEKLANRSVTELRQLVANKFPDSFVTRIEGLDKDENGHEMSVLIDEDHELDAYLAHVHGRKASFMLSLGHV